MACQLLLGRSRNSDTVAFTLPRNSYLEPLYQLHFSGSDEEAPGTNTIWEMWNIPSLPLLRNSVRPKAVVSVRVLSNELADQQTKNLKRDVSSNLTRDLFFISDRNYLQTAAECDKRYENKTKRALVKIHNNEHWSWLLYHENFFAFTF